jgi:hypothetical protein
MERQTRLETQKTNCGWCSQKGRDETMENGVLIDDLALMFDNYDNTCGPTRRCSTNGLTKLDDKIGLLEEATKGVQAFSITCEMAG